MVNKIIIKKDSTNAEWQRCFGEQSVSAACSNFITTNGGHQTLNITLVGQQYPDYLILNHPARPQQDVLPQLCEKHLRLPQWLHRVSNNRNGRFTQHDTVSAKVIVCKLSSRSEHSAFTHISSHSVNCSVELNCIMQRVTVIH